MYLWIDKWEFLPKSNTWLYLRPSSFSFSSNMSSILLRILSTYYFPIRTDCTACDFFSFLAIRFQLVDPSRWPYRSSNNVDRDPHTHATAWLDYWKTYWNKNNIKSNHRRKNINWRLSLGVAECSRLLRFVQMGLISIKENQWSKHI